MQSSSIEHIDRLRLRQFKQQVMEKKGLAHAFGVELMRLQLEYLQLQLRSHPRPAEELASQIQSQVKQIQILQNCQNSKRGGKGLPAARERSATGEGTRGVAATKPSEPAPEQRVSQFMKLEQQLARIESNNAVDSFSQLIEQYTQQLNHDIQLLKRDRQVQKRIYEYIQEDRQKNLSVNARPDKGERKLFKQFTDQFNREVDIMKQNKHNVKARELQLKFLTDCYQLLKENPSDTLRRSNFESENRCFQRYNLPYAKITESLRFAEEVT